jgi:hypothetical protein
MTARGRHGGYADSQLNYAAAGTARMSVDYPAGLFTVDVGPILAEVLF